MMAYPQRVTNEELIAAYRDTGSIWKAATRLGICGQSVHERLKRLGVQLANQNWSEDETKVLSYLAAEGWTISQIASRLGRPYAGVAAKLSELKIRSTYRPARKVPRGLGLTKAKVVAFAKYLLRTGTSVNKAAHRCRISTTSLTSALQQHAADLWAEYLSTHSHLPPKDCPGCGASFIPLTKKQQACTAKCSSTARADMRYFGGKRRDTIGLTEGICQLCLKTGKTLSSHHLLGKENDPDNEILVALCAGCHQLVGILGRRADCGSREFWENLIALAIARAWADKGRKDAGAFVSVDIEPLTEDEVVEALPAHREVKYMPIKDSELPF
jgi:hypothetical protein